MKKVIIFGGTGFLGKTLAEYLSSKGLSPIIVARNKPKSIKYPFIQWDARTLGMWTNHVNNAYTVINLTGKSVDCIKTPDNCDTILRSRVESTEVIGKCLSTIPNPPKIWIQMSTAHIYGDPPSLFCDENSAFGYGLAPTVGKAWEKVFKSSKTTDTRGVILRTSFVIGKDGGALSKLKQICKLGLGGTIGHGKQGMSWIHEDDFNEIVYQSIINKEYDGAYIISAPNPVSQKKFMKTLRNTMNIKIGLPSSVSMIKFGARFILKTDPELAIYGRYVIPQRLLNQGYQFKYPDLNNALESLV